MDVLNRSYCSGRSEPLTRVYHRQTPESKISWVRWVEENQLENLKWELTDRELV